MATNQNDRDRDAIAAVRNFVQSLEKQEVFVTEKVAFDVRELVRTLRKNYWGVYDNPLDKAGRPKLWQALTEFVCDQNAIKRDLDTKDIVWRAKTSEGLADAELARPITQDYLLDTNFGEDMDDAALRCAIDGTVVWKIWEEKDGEGEYVPRRRIVDLLNFYIDPTARSIAESPLVAERTLMTPNEIRGMTGWDNTDLSLLQTDESNRYDRENKNGKTDFGYALRDVWELWGLVPASLFGGKGADVEAHLIVSGIDSGTPAVHLCEKNAKKLRHTKLAYKPYEEMWSQRVPGRWYGKGPAEKVIELQKYLNLILNARVTRHTLSQMGIWKVRENSGITQKSIQGIAANGAIKLRDMADIEQIVVAEAQSTYSDEDRAIDWARKITGVSESLTGERLPASTPATNAALAAQGAQDYFSNQKERDGNFYRRLFSRHVWPVLAKNVDAGYIVRFFRADPRYSELCERVAVNKVIEEIGRAAERGEAPTPEQVNAAIEQAKRDLESSGQIFVEAVGRVADDLEASVEATNEALDVGVTVDKLFKAAELMPQSSEYIVRQALDVMGIAQPPAPVQPQAAPAMPGMPVPSGPMQSPAPAAQFLSAR
jgi:hypothetical protein